MARALDEIGDDFYRELRADYDARRRRLASGLEKVGFRLAPCAGTYFITADVSPLRLNVDDVELCRRMTVEAGVTAVPMSAFYDDGGPDHFIRFCFSKRDAVLDEAIARMAAWLGAGARAGT